MKLIEKTYQSRRDFTGIYECEGCGAQEERRGYDDRFFHDNVTPGMTCSKCGKSRKELGAADTFIETKYPEGFQI